MVSENGWRRKKVPITASVVMHLLATTPKGHTFACVDGIPDNAMFINAHYSEITGITYFIFEHKSWDVIPFGNEIPTFIPQYIRYEQAVTE